MRLRLHRHTQPTTASTRARRRPVERQRRFELACTPTSVAASLAVCLAVVLLVAARRLGPVVIPAALTGAGLAAAHRRRRSRLARAERVALWALHAPSGPTDAEALERLVAADIAAMSADRPGAVAFARAFVRSTVADRWQLELAMERLDQRDTRRRSLRLMGKGRGRRLPASWGIPASIVVILVTAPLSAPFSAAGAAVATAVVVFAWSGMCDDWAYAPQQLAWTALVPPARTAALLPEGLLLELLTELAGGDVGILDDAAGLLETEGRPPRTDLALARMAAVRRVL